MLVPFPAKVIFAANVIRHSDWRIRSFAASNKSSFRRVAEV
jgi:hypothetical protein